MSRVFCLFQTWSFGGYDGCKSGDRDCGWCGGVGVVDLVCEVKMGVVVGGVGTRGEGVVSSGGSVSVADGGRIRWKDCCRFPEWISRELWKDLPYHLPFTLNIDNIGNVFW